MSEFVVGSEKIAKEICDILGLKHVRKLKLELAYDGLFTCEAEFLITKNQTKRLIPVLGKFELVPVSIEEKDGIEDVTTVGEETTRYQFE